MFMPRKTGHLTNDEKLQLLMDERDIRDIHHRWCRAIDRIDVELMKTCFHEDAIDHHAPLFECTGKELAGFMEKGAQRSTESMKYMIGNILFEIDGDVARTECLVFSQMEIEERSKSGKPLLRVDGFRYLDRFERRNGEWRIAERWYVPGSGGPIEIEPFKREMDAIPANVRQALVPLVAKRDKTDKSYDF